MLDAFEIFTTSGVVLWSRSSSSVGANAVNSLINHVFIEERVRPATTSGNPTYKYDKYTLKYTLVKDLGLIFVAVYQSLLSLSWVDKLLNDVRTIFLSVYEKQLRSPNSTAAKYAFDPYFDKELERLDQTTGGAATAEPPRVDAEDKKVSLEEGDTGGPPPPQAPQLVKSQPNKAVISNGDSEQSTPIPTPDTSRPTTPLPGIAPHLVQDKHRPASRGSRRQRKAANATSYVSSGDESRKPAKPQSKGKKGRVWGADGMADEADGANLDYSLATEDVDGQTEITSSPPEAVNQDSWGSRNKKGQFVLKDIDDEVDGILKAAEGGKSKDLNAASASRFGAFSGYFRNIVGGKTLTAEDLDKPLRAMEEHLIQKNVARDAAVRLCDGVRAEMVGKKTGAFESIDAALKPALENSLRKIMTPKDSLVLLQQVESVVKPSSSNVKPRPFVMAILGVNGVGKSTNLSKICYFLLQNDYKVLIAAGDTFRSGAVEQLKKHVHNLQDLSAREEKGGIDIYEKGYGKDAANVAKDAVAYAANNDYQIVLIDTAGRAHTNTQLMAAIEKLVDLAKPDLIFQVAEALVGTDSIGQAQNFTRALGKNRRLSGFIVSKIDTIGDACGTLVSLVHATGVPVQFIGVGQHYGDLREFSVSWAVKMLMS